MSDFVLGGQPDLDLARHQRAGLALLALLLALLVGWGTLSSISGAVVASGKVVVESNVRRVQHKEGGIVSEILVREGDHVVTGQPLVRLDDTVAAANAQTAASQVAQLTARRLRLEAERDGHAILDPTRGQAGQAELVSALTAERRLMEARTALRLQRKAQLREQVVQTGAEISGLNAELASNAAQTRLIQQELAGIRKLYAQGLAPLTRVTQLEREAARLDGERGQLVAGVAKARTHASEIQLQVLQVDSQAMSEIMSDLKDTELRLSQGADQKVATEDMNRRATVLAPAAGYVQQLAIHTRGGVIAPGETLMVIVPEQQPLIVEARIDPRQADRIRPGRTAHIRFTSFSARTTPELSARVDLVSADTQTDEKTGQSYYVARLRIDPASLPSTLAGRIQPGMPAEVQIETSRRSALSYFLKPLTDQLERTFKED